MRDRESDYLRRLADHPLGLLLVDDDSPLGADQRASTSVSCSGHGANCPNRYIISALFLGQEVGTMHAMVERPRERKCLPYVFA